MTTDSVPNDDFTNGSSFFGFMGVSMALVLASTPFFNKIWEQPMAQPKPAQALAASPSGNLQ